MTLTPDMLAPDYREAYAKLEAQRKLEAAMAGSMPPQPPMGVPATHPAFQQYYPQPMHQPSSMQQLQPSTAAWQSNRMVRPPPRCFRCGMYGHMQRDCPMSMHMAANPINPAAYGLAQGNPGPMYHRPMPFPQQQGGPMSAMHLNTLYQQPTM